MRPYVGKPDSIKKIIYDCTLAAKHFTPSAAGEDVVDCIAVAVDVTESPRVDVYV